MRILKAAILFAFGLAALAARAEGPGLGQPLSPNEIPFYATHILPDGTGLPDGSGTAVEGAELFAGLCGYCHGETGIEGPIEPVVGPNDTFPRPAGRFWPYATTLFDYTRRSMPFHQPKSLDDDEVYAITAYILHRNGLIGETERMDATSLPAVAMPNRENFIDLWELRGDEPY